MNFVHSGGSNIYAIIETGGKQYRVSAGMTIDVDRLEAADGALIEIEKVLLIADDDKLTQGAPIIEGAKVMATCRGEAKGPKILIGKFRPKNRYARKNGHRQFHTTLDIDQILRPGESPAKAEAAKPEPEQTAPEVKENGA